MRSLLRYSDIFFSGTMGLLLALVFFWSEFNNFAVVLPTSFIAALFPVLPASFFILPDWFFLILASVFSALILLLKVRLQKNKKAENTATGFLWAVLFLPALTLQIIFLFIEPEITPVYLVGVVLWAVALVEVIYALGHRQHKIRLLRRFLPHLPRIPQWHFWCVVVTLLTIFLTLIVRLQIHEQAKKTVETLAKILPFNSLWTSIIIVFFVLAWVAIIRFKPRVEVAPDTTLNNQQSMFKKIWFGLTVIIILWGAWLRIAAVDKFNFENDEYFHVDAGVGYLKTNEFLLWDHRLERVNYGEYLNWYRQPAPLLLEIATYTRAWPYTWQVAQSFKVFGVSEWAARLPTLVWSIVFLILLAAVTYSWTRSPAVTFFTTAIVAFDNGFVWTAIYTRMYAMFNVLVLASFWLFWKFIQRTCADKEQTRVDWLYFFGALSLAVFNIIIHPEGYLVFVGFAATVLTLWWRERKNARLRLLTLLGTGGIVLFFILNLKWQLVPLSFFHVRKIMAAEYLAFPVFNFILPWLAMLLFIVTIFYHKLKQLPEWIVMAMATILPLLFYFVFIANRYAARKYSLFFLFLFFMVVAWQWQQLSKRFAAFGRAAAVVSTAIFVWFFLPLAVPGVTSVSVLAKARADATYPEMQFHDFRQAYAVLEQNVRAGDAVVMLSPSLYYLHRVDYELYQMPAQSKMTPALLEQIMAAHPRGWVVWPRYKRYHLTKEFKAYTRANLTPLTAAQGTNVLIFQWGQNE